MENALSKGGCNMATPEHKKSRPLYIAKFIRAMSDESHWVTQKAIMDYLYEEFGIMPDRKTIKADGEDLCFVNVSLTDKDGNPVPVDSRLVKVKVSGAGSFKAIANGDPTCLEPFHEPQMHLFSGQLTVLVQSGTEPGDITVEVSGKGVRKAILTIKSE